MVAISSRYANLIADTVELKNTNLTRINSGMSLSVIQRTNPSRIIFCLLHHLNEVHLQDSLGTQLALNLTERLERPMHEQLQTRLAVFL